MRRVTLRLAAPAAAAAVAGAAGAATTTDFSFVGDLTAGYNSNPYLDSHAPGAATIDLSLNPLVTFSTPTGSTVLSGLYDREQYLSNYGHSDLYSASVTHKQQFSNQLSGTAAGSFFDSTSALLEPFAADASPDIDLITSHQRVRSFGGTGGLTWQPSARDSFDLNADVQRTVYPGDVDAFGNYWSYGGSIGYNRVLNARTTVGAEFSVNRTLSAVYPDTTVYEPRATLRQRIDPHWTLDGSAGLILQNSRLGGRTNSTSSYALSASLCGQYPRLNICLNGSHDAEPSGYGGVRLRWQASVTGTYELTEHSRINGYAGYARDGETSGGDQLVSLPHLDLLQANATYDRDLTRKLGLTVTGGYQRRHYDQFGSGSSLSISAGLRVTLGKRR